MYIDVDSTKTEDKKAYGTCMVVENQLGIEYSSSVIVGTMQKTLFSS